MRVPPWVVLSLMIGAAVAGASVALSPPAPRPADRQATAFSALRARPDVAAIAQRPHPTGSQDSIRVRAYLVDRLRDMGLRATVRSAAARRRDGSGVMVHNIVGVLPGTDPSLPAVALMSHYDSTPHGPGAGDDAAGVAASLEIARALQAAGPHRRDLVILITDGEEVGLLGAKAFFGMDLLAPRIAAVINLEARGNSGRAVMFETHRDAGPTIAALRRAGALSGASSLMPDLYRRLPNDTDLTEALKAGKQGLNFAFFGGEAHYHQPTDTPANLDLGAVQHIGDQALAATAALIDAPALPARGPDQVYADLLGGPVLQYPAWAGWLLLLLAGGALTGAAALARRRGAVTLVQIAQGAGLSLIMVLTAGCALVLTSGLALERGGGLRHLLERYPLALAGYAAAAAGAALLILAFNQRRRAAAPLLGPWLGSILLILAAAIVLQALAPLDTFMLAWPLLIAGAAALLWQHGSAAARIAAGLLVTVALAQVFYWAGLMFGLVGVGMPAILAGFVLLALPLVLPFAVPALAQRQAWTVAAAIVLGGAATVILCA